MNQLWMPRFTKALGNRGTVLLDGLLQIEGDHMFYLLFKGSRLRLNSRMRLIPDENDLVRGPLSELVDRPTTGVSGRDLYGVR
jgi:hypothetical protein